MASEQLKPSIKQKQVLLVFDLDYTLWPFWVDTHVTPPFRKGPNNDVVDARGQRIRYYEDVPHLLNKLSDDGYQIGIASRTTEIQGANQLLELHGWTKFINYKEIYPGKKTSHFSKLRKSSNINYENMIFFDDESRNIRDVSQLGVQTVLVENGVTSEIVEEALQKFNKRQLK